MSCLKGSTVNSCRIFFPCSLCWDVPVGDTAMFMCLKSLQSLVLDVWIYRMLCSLYHSKPIYWLATVPKFCGSLVFFVFVFFSFLFFFLFRVKWEQLQFKIFTWARVVRNAAFRLCFLFLLLYCIFFLHFDASFYVCCLQILWV